MTSANAPYQSERWPCHVTALSAPDQRPQSRESKVAPSVFIGCRGWSSLWIFTRFQAEAANGMRLLICCGAAEEGVRAVGMRTASSGARQRHTVGDGVIKVGGKCQSFSAYLHPGFTVSVILWPFFLPPSLSHSLLVSLNVFRNDRWNNFYPPVFCSLLHPPTSLIIIFYGHFPYGILVGARYRRSRDCQFELRLAASLRMPSSGGFIVAPKASPSHNMTM